MEKQHRNQSYFQFGLALILLILINVLSHLRIGDTPLYTNWDLTDDKRYTLTDHTRTQLSQIDNPILVRILLTGNLPAEYERLKDKTEEILQDFRKYNQQIEYQFTDPLAGQGDQVRERQRQLAEDGILPVTVFTMAAGERKSRAVYPYAILTYGDRQRIIPMLEASLPGVPEPMRINQAESLLEYKLSQAIESLTNNDKPLIGFTVSNGELPPIQRADFVETLRKDYDIGPVYIDSFASIPSEIELLIIAKPTIPFTDFEAFKIDQYIMNGGKVLFAIDAVAMDYDSLRNRNEYYPEERKTGLEHLFFKYGFRIDPVLALDLVSTRIPIVAGNNQGQPNIQLLPFPYHVMAIPDGSHPIVNNLDPISLQFPTVITPVNEDNDVERTVLLKSSKRSRRQRLPSPIDLDVQKYNLDQSRFNEDGLPFAILLEGSFQSPYANRLSQENARVLKEIGQEYQSTSESTRMIVISDGDIMVNHVKNGNRVLPLGVSKWEKGIRYANKFFLLNAVEYLLNPDGVIAARNKEVTLRLLDQPKAFREINYWRVVNLILPILMLGVFGIIFIWLRRRRYAGRANKSSN